MGTSVFYCCKLCFPSKRMLLIQKNREKKSMFDYLFEKLFKLKSIIIIFNRTVLLPMIIASDAACFLILLHSTGQDLQLPRGKGPKRNSRPYTKEPHLIHPPPHSHKKDSHSTGITLLFSNSAWVFLCPTELSPFKEL